MALHWTFFLLIGVTGAVRSRRKGFDSNGCTGPACEALSETEFDFVVVGTGAGGGTVAARLAEAGKSVLVLEAGVDAGNKMEYQMPVMHAKATETPGLGWNYFVKHYEDSKRADLDTKNTPKGILYPRGGTLGGSTAVNAMLAVLPKQSDWDRMAALTNDKGWEASSMNKFEVDVVDSWMARKNIPLTDLLGSLLNPEIRVGALRRLTRIIDGAFEMIGANNDTSDGDDWGTLIRKIGEYSEFFSHDINDELRKGDAKGAYGFPQSIRDGKRTGSRERLLQSLSSGKLTIKTQALVSRVIFSNARPLGGCDGPCRAKEVVFLDGRGLYGAEINPSSSSAPEFRVRVREGGEIILSAGAFNTPQLLKQSGIGPKAELDEFNLPVHVDLIGVGKNLQDRYELGLETEFTSFDDGSRVPFVDPRDCNFEAVDGDLCFKHWSEKGTGLYSTSGAVMSFLWPSGLTPESDLHIFALPGPFRGYKPGYSLEIPKKKQRNKFTWTILKGHTDNRGGTVNLRCAQKDSNGRCLVDPRATPDINFHYFDEGVEYDELDSSAVDHKGERDLEAMVRAVELVRNIQNRTNDKMATTNWGMLEEWPGWEFGRGENFSSPREKIREFVKREAWGHHASCTAPMGCIPGDEMGAHNSGAGVCVNTFNPNTVIDSRFRVRGTEGLRVVDASAFPRIPGTFLLLPTYILSEKGAATIIEDHVGKWPICPGAFAKSITPNDRDNCECRDGLRCYEGDTGCTTSWTEYTGLRSRTHFSLGCHGCRCI